MVDGRWRYDPNEDHELNIYNTHDNIIQVFPAAYEWNKDESDDEDLELHRFSDDGVKVKIGTELTGK